MRAFPLALLLAACAASPKDESTTVDYCWPVFSTTHELAWGAARKAAAWTRTVDEVDTADWTIRCSGGTTWQLSPRRDPNGLLWVNLTMTPPTLPNEQTVSAVRFSQALDLIRHGRPLPEKPPSTEGTSRRYPVDVCPGRSADGRRDGWKG
ncbi:MAG TPA: hypothetical protein VFY93_13365 [Planctomycetota bacterium]|nr:hypothetical protein [Planctomycetota bacterium]